MEFGLLGQSGFLDARAWKPTEKVNVKVVAYEEGLEVYLDDRLMIHQVRHRETTGQVALFVDKAEVRFTEMHLSVFPPLIGGSRMVTAFIPLAKTRRGNAKRA